MTSSAANETRRSVMNVAWSFRRSEPSRTFGDCLRGAWKWVKKLAMSAGAFTARARRDGGRLNLSPSLIRSSSTSALKGVPFGGARDRQAGVMISRIGR